MKYNINDGGSVERYIRTKLHSELAGRLQYATWDRVELRVDVILNNLNRQLPFSIARRIDRSLGYRR